MGHKSLRAEPIILLLIGVWLRFHALVQDARFHPDEALFATFARNAAVQGDWLLHGSLDKTPLTIYADALAMTAFGVTTLPDGVLTLDIHRGEFAARVPGVFASILWMAVTCALAKSVYRRKPTVPLVALLLMAISPFALAFSATVFTDGLMILCVTLALWMGSRRRWFWAGLWLAAGLWCKQQALFYIPLVLVVGWIWRPTDGLRARVSIQDLFRLCAPLVIGITLLAVWDGARGQSTSLWALAVANNEPGRLELAQDFMGRLGAWLAYAQYMFGESWLTWGLLMLAVMILVVRIKRERWATNTQIDVIWLVYVFVYSLLHVSAFNLYDRYWLLILLPLLLLVAGGIDYAVQRAAKIRPTILIFVTCALGILMFPAAVMAVERQLPIGGDNGKYDGIDALGAYLNSKPLGTIIYDHWLGWELGYYIGTWSDKRRVYYPTPDALTADALLQPDPAPRYMVIPIWVQDAEIWITPLLEAGFEVITDHTFPNYVVVKLIPPDEAA
ncbi:MAG: glycosyltransferase family 39 protein [Anaerolineae bacterium]